MPYKRIDLAPFVPKEKGRFGWPQPFAMTFVYPKNSENFVVTGPSDQVDAFMKDFASKNPCFWRYTFWKDGETRGGWMATHFYVCHKTKREVKGEWGEIVRKGPTVHEISGYDKDGNDIARFVLRRMPHRWIPEFDQFLVGKPTSSTRG